MAPVMGAIADKKSASEAPLPRMKIAEPFSEISKYPS